MITESTWQSEKAFKIAGESSSLLEWDTVHSAERTLVIGRESKRSELSRNMSCRQLRKMVIVVLAGKTSAFILQGKRARTDQLNGHSVIHFGFCVSDNMCVFVPSFVLVNCFAVVVLSLERRTYVEDVHGPLSIIGPSRQARPLPPCQSKESWYFGDFTGPWIPSLTSPRGFQSQIIWHGPLD